MSKRYYGDFRSVDNSADPKGQRYRVVIFTGYDGSNPYEYQTIIRPSTHGYDFYVGRVPVNNYALTMTDRPFVVNYEGDDENIYKPYRCSTATINFRQANINLDFLNSNGTSTLVVLLKWKNEVSEVGGRMYNSSTGETLNKHVVIENPHSEFPITWYNDYDPDRYDNFCFTVEWVGYATPETFSMEYSHVADTFTLNAQDAFSALQFSKYDRNPEANALANGLDELLDPLKQIGAYRKVYVTDTIKFPDVFAVVFSQIVLQTANNYDEDGKPVTKLDVLTRLLTYFNLTAIPYKNNLIITTPNAIAEGWNYYYTYTLPNNGYIINFPTDGDTYTAQPCEELSDTYAITQNSFASGATTISTANVYNSVTVEDDIYYIDNILPNFRDADNFTDKTHSNENVTYGGTRYHWRYNSMTSAIASIETFQYDPDTYTYTANMIDPETDTYNITYTITFSDQLTEFPVHYGNGYVNHPTCIVMDNYGVSEETPDNKNRVLYFHSMPWQYSTLPAWYDGHHMSNTQCQQNFRSLLDGQSKSQRLLRVTSKSFWGNDNVYLQLTGNWTFYHNRFNNISRYPHQFDSSLNTTVGTNNSYTYVYAKIKYGDYWLKNTAARGVYTWDTTEQYIKLWYDANSNAQAFGSPFNFTKSISTQDGIVVKLPHYDNIANVTIEIYRPLGCVRNTASVAILNNLDLQLKTERELFDDEYTGSGDNSEYKSVIDDKAVTEFSNQTNNICSDSDKQPNFSQVLRTRPNNTYDVMTKLYNVATGDYVLAEQGKVKATANQYSTPTVGLRMTLHSDITPYTLVTWSKLGNCKFTVNSTETDYEYNTQTVTLTETKATTAQSEETRRNCTRNYRRNEDIISHDRVTRVEREILFNDPLENTATFAASNGYITATSDDVEIGCLTIQPNFNDCAMQISVPNDLDDTLTVEVEDRQLIITY